MSKPFAIRKFIKSVLHERAATSKMASQRNLALMTHHESGKYRTHVLFDRNAFVHAVIATIRAAVKYDPNDRAFSKPIPDFLKKMKRPGDAKEWVYEQLINRYSEYMIATIDMGLHSKYSQGGQANGAWQVHGPAAIDKYGPLIYDIAMQDAGELMPDRNGLPSPFAQNVWKYYKNNRSDVVSTPLDDKYDPQTPQESDDSIVHNPGKDSFGNFLDSSYHMTGPGPDLSSMRATYNQMIKTLRTIGVSQPFVKRVLIAASDNFFDEVEMRKKSS